MAAHLPEYRQRAEQKYLALRATMREGMHGGEFGLDPGALRLAVARAFGRDQNPRTGRFLMLSGLAVRILEPVRSRWARGEVTLYERDGQIFWRSTDDPSSMAIDLAPSRLEEATADAPVRDSAVASDPGAS